MFSLMTCVSSRAIVSNSFISVALRCVNARNTPRLISVTWAFSIAFTSVSWVRAALLCDSAAVSSLPKSSRHPPMTYFRVVACSTVELAGWLVWIWVVVLNSCSATVYGMRFCLWIIGLTHSLLTEVTTGVLWVSTGTHPCGPPCRQEGGGTRAPALRTLDDVLRLSRRCVL